MRRIQRIREAVELRHLLKRRQQAETDDVEQRHGTTGDVIYSIAPDHLLDDLVLDGVAGQRLSQRQHHRLDLEQPRDFLHLLKGQLPLSGNQLGNEPRGDPRGTGVPTGRRVFCDRIVRDNEDHDAVVEWCPAENVVLSQGPLLVKQALEVNKVATLSQSHVLGKPGQLVQVWRKIGYAPDAGLRKVDKFHVCAQSGFRTPAFSATVRTDRAGTGIAPIPAVESNQLLC